MRVTPTYVTLEDIKPAPCAEDVRETQIALRRAVQKGDADLVKEVVCNSRQYAESRALGNKFKLVAEQLVNVLLSDDGEKERSPLHIAVGKSYPHIVELLISYGADVDIAEPEYNDTPLFDAAWHGSNACAMKLIEHDADIGHLNGYGQNALQLASWKGNDGLLCMFIQHAVRSAECYEQTMVKKRRVYRVCDLVNNTDNFNETPLINAVNYGNVACTKLLIEHGADIDIRNKENKKPIHLAASHGSEDIIRLLTDKALEGVDVNERSEVLSRIVNEEGNESYTPLHMAVRRGYLQAVEMLLQLGADVNLRASGCSALHIAAIGGWEQIIESLVRHGADINAKDDKARTPLHKACLFGRAHPVRVLVEHRALLDEVDDKCYTAVMHAIAKKEDRIVKYLIKNGADIHAVGSDGKTTLHMAIETNQLEMIDLLLMMGGERFTSVDRRGPLHLSMNHGNIKVVDMLLKSHGRIEEKGETVTSLLHAAASKGDTTLIAYLISVGLSVASVNIHGQTPLHFAARHGQLAAVELLVESGSDVDVMDDQGHTALHLAIISDQVECLLCLLEHGTSTQDKNYLEMALQKSDRGKRREVCMAMITHARWGELLSVSPPRSPPLGELIRYAPEVAQVVLDQLITHESRAMADKTHHDYTVTHTYTVLADMCTQFFAPAVMVRYEADALLLHPVTQAYLDVCWKRFGYVWNVGRLVVYLLFLTLLTITVIWMKNYDADISTHPWIVLVCGIVAGLLLLKEVIEMFIMSSKYLREIENYFELFLYISALVFTISLLLHNGMTSLNGDVGGGNGTNSNGNQFTENAVIRRSGGISILLAWLNIMFYVKPLFKIGIYVKMFEKVVVLASLVFCTFVTMFVGFGFCFFVILKDDAGFLTPKDSVLKAVVMMTGELGYENQYSNLSAVFFIMFVILMTIVFVNLLVGLAIGEIDKLQKSSLTTLLGDKVHLVVSYHTILHRFSKSTVPCIGRIGHRLLRRCMAINRKDYYPNRNNLFGIGSRGTVEVDEDANGSMHEDAGRGMAVELRSAKEDIAELKRNGEEMKEMLETLLKKMDQVSRQILPIAVAEQAQADFDEEVVNSRLQSVLAFEDES